MRPNVTLGLVHYRVPRGVLKAHPLAPVAPAPVALVRGPRRAHLGIEEGAGHGRVGVTVRIGDDPRVEGRAPIQQRLSQRVRGRLRVRQGHVAQRRSVHPIERGLWARRPQVLSPPLELRSERGARVRRRGLKGGPAACPSAAAGGRSCSGSEARNSARCARKASGVILSASPAATRGRISPSAAVSWGPSS